MIAEVTAIEFDSPEEAIRHAKTSSSSVAIRLWGKNLAVQREEAHRLEREGESFAYLSVHGRTGRMMMVPVNSGTSP